jgi:hypothetical protein
MQGVRNKMCVEIVTDPLRLIKLVAQPTFSSFKIFNEDVAAVHKKKKKIILNKPIAVGFAILDLAKLKMYEFYYKYLKKKYGDRVKLLGTDTDSFIIEIETDDFYKDIEADIDMFDTSNFPTDHYLYSTKNKRAIGKIKSEFGTINIDRFCGLQAKLYAMDCAVGKTTKKAKGVPRTIIEKLIRFAHYKNSLFNNEVYYFNSDLIRSKKHVLYTLRNRKKCLQPLDDKRYVLNHPSHQTLALGHYQIPYLEHIHQCLTGQINLQNDTY